MKQKKCTKVFALLFAALFLFTSLPLSGLSALAYQHGEVVEEAPADMEGPVSSAPEEAEQDPIVSLTNGTVEEDNPVAEDNPSPAASPGPIEGSVAKGNDDEWVCLPLEYTVETGVRKTRAARTVTATTKKVHYYRTMKNYLENANGASFTLTGGAAWDNTYVKVVVPLDENGKEITSQAAAAYCLNHNLGSPTTGGAMTQMSNISSISAAQRTAIGDILACGYKGATGHTIPESDYYKWTITQLLIWAVRAGKLRYNSTTGVTEFAGGMTMERYKSEMTYIGGFAGDKKSIDEWNRYAGQLISNVLMLRAIPQFCYRTEAEANSLVNTTLLKKDESSGKYIARRTFLKNKNDSTDFYNNTLKKWVNPKSYLTPDAMLSDFAYKDGHGMDGITLTYRVEADVMAEGYGVEISSDEDFEGIKVSNKLTREIKGGQNAAIVYEEAGANTQQIATFVDVSETLPCYFAVRTRSETEAPVSSGIHKEAEDGVAAGVQFTLTSDGKTFTKTTDSNGNIDISNLPLYKQKDKTDENGNVLTNPDGTNQTEDDLDNPITYTVRENVPVRYVTPAEQGCKITPAYGESVTFHNILKKWKVSFTKSDPQATSAQKNRHNGAEGDATLASAEYGLYCNGELIDTFYTNENGQFETWDYYPCGSADGPLYYTIREISPSTGYLLNSEEIALQTDPARYTQEFNTAPAVSGTEQIIKGDIYLTKHTDKGETGIEEPEKGAKFQIYLKSSGSYANALPEERDELTIDADGHAKSKKLPYGVYTVHQTEGWEYKEMVDDFDVFISQNGKTYDYILNNRPFEALVTIMKKDIDSGRVIPMSGVGFKVRNRKTGQYVVQHINYPTPRDLSTFYTDVTGKLMMPEKLDGGEYELIEVVAAYGYVLDSTPVPFVVDGTVKEVVVEKSNQAQKSALRIYKHGQVFSNVLEGGSEYGTIYQPLYADGYLQGATYEVRAVDDITTPDGTIRAIAGSVVDTITTDKDGMATSKPLYLGHYYVVETKAPAGYVLDGTMQHVKLSYTDSTQEVSLTTIHLNDEKQKVVVSAAKHMEEDRDFGYKVQKGVENVRFGLFAAEEIKTADGKAEIPADGLIEVGTVNDGRVTFEFQTDLPFGNYYLKELKTDDAYLLNEGKWAFTVEAERGVFKVNQVIVTDNRAIENTLKRGDILGVKVDEDGAVLPDALFGLFLPGETEFTEETAVRTALSSRNGDFYFTGLPYGSYIVREISVPEGFVLNQTSYPVIIHEDGQKETLKVENKYIKSDVVLEKIDKDYSGTRLSGAEFTVYRDPNKSGVVKEDSEKVGVLNETERGIYTMDQLRYGDYLIVETKAPKYYHADKTPITVSVKRDDEVIKLTKPNKAVTGSVKIKKVSEDGVVADIKFTVSGKPHAGGSYEEEFETDESGEIFIDDLRIGDYTVSEVLDESTVKYQVEEPKQVTVTSGSTAEVEFYNQLRRGSIYVIKTDPDYPESKLSGAEFTVYQDEDYNGKFDPEVDHRVVTLQEDGGLYWTESLAAGSYFLRETKAPDGYVLDTEYHYFEIDKDTRQIEITNTIDEKSGFINRKITGSLKIVKKAASGNKLLKGANFCVRNTEGEVVAEGTTDENGEILFEGLPFGDYTYQEISAPAGFERDSSEYPFKIKLDGKVVEVTAINHKAPFYVPQTGDGKTNPTFWLMALAIFAGLGTVVTAVCLIRKKSKDR